MLAWDDIRYGLDVLLHPLGRAEFLDTYWGRRPLHVPGAPDKLETIFQGRMDRGRVLQMLDDAASRRTSTVKAQGFLARATDGDVTGELPAFYVDAASVPSLLDSGMPITIAVYDLQEVDATLEMLVTSIRRDIGAPMKAGCHLWHSIDGARVPTHFDAAASIQIQLEGEKIWRVAPVALEPWPYSGSAMRADGTAQVYTDGFETKLVAVDRGEFVEVTMRPGDVLYVPAGCWHETEAAARGCSLALNLFLKPRTFAEILVSALDETFVTDAAWRTPSPSDGERSAHRERLVELQAALVRFEADPSVLARASARLAAEIPRRGPAAGTASGARLARAVRIDPETRLRPGRGAPITCARIRLRDDRLRMYLYHGEAELLSDDPEDVGFAEALLRQVLPFRAGEACGWHGSARARLPWSVVVGRLRKLVEVGFVEPCP